MSWKILLGDVREQLATLPDQSVQCCVTSPPYWGLRDYGTATWDGGDPECDHRKPANGSDPTKGSTLGGGKKTTGHSQEPWGGSCGKCGARRIDNQIGLESTPDAYVETMVEVFRDVRRVLRDDGTLWLNLGDSYATGAGKVGGRPGGGTQGDNWKGAMTSPNRMPIAGLKPKDLVGIPWSVAKALQAPYYTGKIKRIEDRIWLAAMIDAEGCIFIHKRKVGQSNGQGYVRKNDSYGSGLEVSNTNRAIVDRCMEIVGMGSICEQSPEQNHRRKQTIYRWNLRLNICRDVLREVYPHLVAKQHEARLAIGCPSSGAKAATAHESLKALHNGRAADIDFPAPSSMYEPGWWLRSDIIWSKPSPMPESVTDRPTKAHEYVFLLTKSARYFWDAEAVAEPFSDERMGNPGGGTRNYAPEDRNDGTDSRMLAWDKGAERAGRNVRSVWEITTQPYAAAHFATFPEALPERCIKAGSREPGKRCDCDEIIRTPTGSGVTNDPSLTTGRAGMNRQRRENEGARLVTRRQQRHHAEQIKASPHREAMAAAAGQAFDHYVRIDASGARPLPDKLMQEWTVNGWITDAPACDCPQQADTVLDPFCGAGTTGLVADRLRRDFIGIELNPEYLELARKRIGSVAPLFPTEVTHV